MPTGHSPCQVSILYEKLEQDVITTIDSPNIEKQSDNIIVIGEDIMRSKKYRKTRRRAKQIRELTQNLTKLAQQQKYEKLYQTS